MDSSPSVPAVLVSIGNSLKELGGGVQLCTQDYLLLLKLAGFNLEVISFEADHRILTRLRRKLGQRPYDWIAPPSLQSRVVAAVERSNASAVFFNLLEFPSLARHLSRRFGNKLKLVHLSHGLDSTDMCIDQQVQRCTNGDIRLEKRAARSLGAKIQFEADYRRFLDAVLCLSPIDAHFERWLGAKQVAWFSRPVRERPLPARPIANRVGCVATLDHPPNWHGLVLLLDCLNRRNLTRLSFRLCGGPDERGKELAIRFPFVNYLGRLSDSELREEAASWSCFVHPLFHFARGCSTKLAVALGWRLPIATTLAGARGYVWDESVMPLATTPTALADLVASRSQIESYESLAQQTVRIAALQPSPETLARQMSAFLVGTPGTNSK